MMKRSTIQFISIILSILRKHKKDGTRQKKFEKYRTKNILDICIHFAFLHLIKLIANISVEERDTRWKS